MKDMKCWMVGDESKNGEERGKLHFRDWITNVGEMEV